MIIRVDTNCDRSKNMCEDIFVVNYAEDAAKTIELMRYLQRWRPERQIVEYLELGNDLEALTLLRIMEELEWAFPLRFRAEPNAEIKAIIKKNNWSYALQNETI